MSPKCFARNLRETVRGVTPSRPRDDGTIRSVEDRERNEGDAEKEERSKSRKLNAKYTWDPWQFLGIGLKREGKKSFWIFRNEAE